MGLGGSGWGGAAAEGLDRVCSERGLRAQTRWRGPPASCAGWLPQKVVSPGCLLPLGMMGCPVKQLGDRVKCTPADRPLLVRSVCALSSPGRLELPAGTA